MAGLMILVGFLAAGAFAKRIATDHELLQQETVANGPGILPGSVQSFVPLRPAVVPPASMPVGMSMRDSGNPGKYPAAAVWNGLGASTRVQMTASNNLDEATVQGATQSAGEVTPNTEQATVAAPAHWMDHLKFGGSTPTFDVIEKTKQYAACKTAEEVLPLYADDYVFRGSIIGPISGQEVRDTQEGFNIQEAYPDIDRGIFGFTIDPENPYRCLFFERWTATNTGKAKLGPLTIPPTGNVVKTPMHVSSITWNPEGKIIYNSISPPVDRFEGNTMGSGAVFGLLTGAGVDGGVASVGLPSLMLQQKIVQKIGILGKQWSDEADVPAWWKSKARGADPNDI